MKKSGLKVSKLEIIEKFVERVHFLNGRVPQISIIISALLSLNEHFLKIHMFLLYICFLNYVKDKSDPSPNVLVGKSRKKESKNIDTGVKEW